MSFAVEQDSPCGFCELKDRVKLCPFYLTRCRYYDKPDNKTSPRNEKESKKGYEKTVEENKK